MIGNFRTSKSLNVREREYCCFCSYYVIDTYASLMYELKKNWKGIYEQICCAPGPCLIKKIIYRAAVSQRLGNTALFHRKNQDMKTNTLFKQYFFLHRAYTYRQLVNSAAINLVYQTKVSSMAKRTGCKSKQ
jgi:hypothetical protein